MSEDIFDAIIVGAGPAGSVAAYLLAKAGLEVLVIERGNQAGAKNMTGGRLYAHSLERILPDFAAQAPVERQVTRERVSMLTADKAVTVDYQNGLEDAASKRSYTVLRGPFDRWLMEQAEAAGAQFIAGIRVDAPLLRNNKVCGVRAGDEEMEARVVILADGVNSILGEQLGMTTRVNPHTTAVGVKELLELPAAVIEDRFNLAAGEGAAWLFAGTPSDGLMGGGFIYTNKTSLSVGVVCGLHDIARARKSVPQMLEDFKEHPSVAPLLKGATLVEYAGHVVPEGGLAMVPELVRDGVLIVGDAAGLCLNMGYTVRGMDLAIASGEAAARAVIAAARSGDFSSAGLQSYTTRLNESCVMRDMTHYKRLPALMENPRIFNEYPRLATGVMHDVFTVGGFPPRPLWRTLWDHCRDSGLMNLVKDAIQGGRAL